MKKIVKQSCFFASLSPDFWQFQKQLITKSETHLDSKPLENYYRYTNADLKISLYVWVHIKIIP